MGIACTTVQGFVVHQVKLKTAHFSLLIRCLDPSGIYLKSGMKFFGDILEKIFSEWKVHAAGL